MLKGSKKKEKSREAEVKVTRLSFSCLKREFAKRKENRRNKPQNCTYYVKKKKTRERERE